MSDRELREAVEQALDFDPGIDSKAIGVAAQDGIVTLTGHVPSYAEKREAEKVSGLVCGVKAVVCELSVARPIVSECTDEEIAHAASNAIGRNALLPHDSIHVYVDHGRVTLEGAVDWQYQRKAAGKCVRYLAGVRDVNNHIVVKPRAEQVAVKKQIEAELLRNAQLDANHIQVDIRGDRVILSGKVQSWPEREAAERAAWNAPGVADVENLLTVNPVSNLVAY